MNTYLASPPKDSLLRLLHSDLGRADLIDSVLATGKRYEYVFVTSPGSKDSRGRTAYHLAMGRPLNYSRGCEHSFLTDEAGVFHFTTENRAATNQDPILQ